MIQDKELLLKDLCARLPYGIKAQDYDDEPLFTIVGYECLYFCDDNGWEYKVDEVKPYLFPLSSITEEQKSYINGRWGVNKHFEFEIDPLWGEYFVDLGDAAEFINWCYENHFDINGLIPKGLAIDATGLNIY